MITIELNLTNKLDKVQVRDEIFLNSLLVNNHKLIKKYIKSIYPPYRISDAFFAIVNNFVDFDEKGISLYAGLIVRTGLKDFAVLYLENSTLDEEYMMKLIDEYIKNVGDFKGGSININKFEIKKETVTAALKNM